MMWPSFLLLCPPLTSSPYIDIRITHETQNLPVLSFSLFFLILIFFLFRSSSLLFSPSVIQNYTACVHLMKRTREDFTTSSKPRHFEDPMVRVMQDYRELHMENEAMRKRLETVRERKAILMAEVRFLRRRRKQLKQEQLIQPPDTIKKIRGKSNGEKSKKQVSPNDVETKQVSLPDLNYSGKVYEETKTTLKRRIPLFDLNQISGEQEEETEVVNNLEKMREEENSSCKMMSNIEQKEMKLSSCRNGGNGSNKRKISWQDPITALKV